MPHGTSEPRRSQRAGEQVRHRLQVQRQVEQLLHGLGHGRLPPPPAPPGAAAHLHRAAAPLAAAVHDRLRGSLPARAALPHADAHLGSGRRAWLGGDEERQASTDCAEPWHVVGTAARRAAGPAAHDGGWPHHHAYETLEPFASLACRALPLAPCPPAHLPCERVPAEGRQPGGGCGCPQGRAARLAGGLHHRLVPPAAPPDLPPAGAGGHRDTNLSRPRPVRLPSSKAKLWPACKLRRRCAVQGHAGSQ